MSTGLDRERAVRSVRRCERAAGALASARDPESIQECWEEWAIAWRIAVDLLEGYGKRNKLIEEKLREISSKREASPDLAYVWAAGNAERHNPDGSTDRTNGHISINQARMDEPLIIDRLIIANGQIVDARMRNASVEVSSGSVNFKDIPIRNGAVSAPAEASPESLRKAGSSYIAELARMVMPRI